MTDIAAKVKSLVADKLGVDEAEVVESASFTSDLGADSLDVVELVMEFEKEFGVIVPDSETGKIGTVGQAISYIEEHIKK
jgi:acyl carrier protein